MPRNLDWLDLPWLTSGGRGPDRHEPDGEGLDGETRDGLTRAQLVLLNTLCDEVSLAVDDRRQALNLTEREWLRWTDFLADGPLPPEPELPEMLQRVGEVAFHLTLLADRPAGRA